MARQRLGWRTLSAKLPSALSLNEVFYWNGSVYSVGGSPTNAAATCIPEIYAAKVIGSSGTDLGPWKVVGTMPERRFGPATTVHNGFIYLLGGRDITNTSTSSLYVGAINSDGTITSWRKFTGPYIYATGPKLIVVNGHLCMVDMNVAGGSQNNGVQTALLNSDGSPGQWFNNSGFNLIYQPEDRLFHVWTKNNWLYLAGGEDVVPNALNKLARAKVMDNGVLGPWQILKNLPTAWERGAVAQQDGYGFMIGGCTGTATNTATTNVWSGMMDSEGVVSEWFATSPLQTARRNCRVANAAGVLFAVGGVNGAGTVLDTVEVGVPSFGVI